MSNLSCGRCLHLTQIKLVSGEDTCHGENMSDLAIKLYNLKIILWQVSLPDTNQTIVR